MEASNEATHQGETNDPFNEPVNTDYGYEPLQIPKDEEGFVVTFDKDDVNSWKNFFDTYGIVVIRNIISDEEADRTADEVWQYLKKMLSVEKDVSFLGSSTSTHRHKDPNTWERWPWGKHLGILGSDLTLSQQACTNREHPNIYDFFCKLYGETELYTSVDRVGMMRPTKGIKFPGQEELVDKPEWKTKSEWLHWDMNPWTGKTSMYGWQGNKPEEPFNKGFDYLMVQGILGLYDCGPNDGGFHAVPGFHKHIQAWAKANEHLRERNTYPKVYDETTVQVPRLDPIRHDVQKMPLRKGSLLIWHSAIPHGTFPNDSNRFRLIQYMKMAPASYPHILPFYQSDSHFRPMYPFPEDVVLTELGKKIYGFKPWKPQEEKSRCVLIPQEKKRVARAAANFNDEIVMDAKSKAIYAQVFDPAVAAEFQAALLARTSDSQSIPRESFSDNKRQEKEFLIDEYSYSFENDPEIPQYGYFNERGELTWYKRSWIDFQVWLRRPYFKIGKSTVTGRWILIAAIIFVALSLILGLAIGLSLSSTQFLIDPNMTVAQVAGGIMFENGTVVLSRDTVPNPTLWNFIQYSTDVDKITITDAKVLVTNRSSNAELAKIEISGHVSIVDFANATCNAVLTFNGDTQDFSAANMNLFLEVNFAVHWNPLMSLPLLTRHATSFGYNITANNGAWMSDISLISSGTLTITTLATFTRNGEFNFVPGVHLHVDELKIEGQGLVNSLGSFLDRELGDTKVFLKLYLPFAMIHERQSFAELSLLDDNGLQLGPVRMHSSSVVFRIEGIGPSPLITLQTDLNIPLAPLNPNLNLTLNGNFNSESRAMVLKGEISPWPNPFGLPYMAIDRTQFNLTMTQRSHVRNRASAFVNRFNVEAYLLTGARVNIPRIPEMSAQVLGTINNGNLAFFVNDLDVPSIDEVIKSLLGIDVPSLRDKFDITNRRMSMALASSYRTRINLPIDHMMNGMVIGRGMTLVTPAVKVTDLIGPVRDLFPGRDFGELILGATVPVFDALDVTGFKDQFEVFLKSTPFDIDSKLRFLGFGIVAKPFAVPVSLSVAAELELKMPEQDSLIFHVEGQVQSGQVTIGGAMIGMWYNAFNVNGLHIGNVTAEIGIAPGPVISTIGLGAAIQIGRAEISFLGRASIDLDDSFVNARVENLYLTDIVQFFKDLNVDFLDRIDIDDIPDNVRLNLLLVTFATKDGELQGIPYSKGFRIAADAELLGVTATASVASTQALVANVPVTDLLISFGIRFDNLADIILDFVERILPFDLPSLDEILAGIGIRFNLNNVLGLKSVELSDFSLFNVMQGDFPELTIVIVLAGHERRLSLNLDLKSLGNGLGNILELSNVPEDAEFLSCVINAHCEGRSGSVCDHTQTPWRCAAECPQGSVSVENAGCWPSNSTEANGNARRGQQIFNTHSFMNEEHLQRFEMRKRNQIPAKYVFK